MGTGFKASSLVVSSGTLDAGNNRIAIDVATAGLGDVTINSGAVLRCGRSGATSGDQIISRTGSSRAGTLTVASGGKLDLSGADPRIDMNSVVFSGTVEYTAAGAQALTTKGLDASSANPNTYSDLILNGTSAKTLGLNTTVNGTITMAGTASLALSTFTLTYGGSSTLKYAGSSAQTTTTAEFPASSGPLNLKINNVNGVTLSSSKTIGGSTSVSLGKLLVNGSLTSNGGLTVDFGATLGGTGTASGGTVTVNGTIAPGASIGTLNTGSQTWAPGGTNEVEIGTATGTAGLDWDFLNITGDLNITVTNNAPAANKFTLKVIGTLGGITNFDKTLSYTWRIATNSGTVYGFNAPKFNLDTTGVTNVLAGAFTVVLNGRSVELVYTPITCSGTTTASSGVTNSNMHMFFVNTEGLASVQALTLSNCVIYGTNYDSAGNELAPYPDPITPVSLTARTNLHANAKKLLLVAVKVNPLLSAAVNVIVMDQCGRGKSFDPVITTLKVTEGNFVQQRFEGLLSAEHYLRVVNATPGLRSLDVNLNGRNFHLDLADGQDVSADLGGAMLEGLRNVVVLTGIGEVGSSALVLITDTPTGNEIPLSERVRLTLTHTAAGLMLAWPEALTDWQLQSSATANGDWSNVTATPAAADGQLTLAVPTTGSAQFYRLHPATTAGRPAASGSPTETWTTLPGTTQPQTLTHSYDALLW
jgi:hypothetical protein